MKLTSKVLDRLIREVIAEQKHQPFKSAYDREQHLQKQQQEAEERRQKQKEMRPDYELMRLSKGIISEGELIDTEDEEGFVKIKASALNRLLVENEEQLQKQCNANSFYKLDQILDFIARMNKAQKGK